MNLIFKYSLLIFVFITASINGQIVSESDTISGTPLRLSMDQRISNLMEELEGKCLREGTTSPTKSSGNEGITVRPSGSSRPLTRAEICRQNPTILGYKIQIAVVKSNKEANEVKAYFRRRFPSIKVETNAALRPNYRILAGSYASKQSAARDLSRIRQYFNQARSVQYRVFCEEAQ